jgi:hypothetical protein
MNQKRMTNSRWAGGCLVVWSRDEHPGCGLKDGVRGC